MHSFRVNFGNGQITNTFRTRKEAFKELAVHLPNTPDAFIQFQDGCEWFTLPGSRPKDRR